MLVKASVDIFRNMQKSADNNNKKQYKYNMNSPYYYVIA